MKMRTASATLTCLGVLFAPALARAAIYYVAPAPTGSDSNAGTQDAPFATFAKAQMTAAAGDTVYFRGGKYAYTAGTNTCTSQTATVNAIVLNKSGSAGKLIQYWAQPGETPVFDFSGMKDDCRVKGFDVTGNYIHLKGLEVTGVPQNNNLNHESWGVWVSGSNNIFEQLNTHHNMGPGLFIQDGGNNLVLNCDSHHNYDPLTSNGAGQSADGFGCHVSANHPGNVFRGCRAWWNSDDGYDFINAYSVCTIENSWAWYHGYLPDTMTAVSAGNGNGIKAGGYGAAYEANAPQHVVRNCLSVANKAAGFYANHHPDSPYFYNNTSYNNKPDYNMLGIDSGGGDATVGIYRNNIALAGSLFSNRTNADETSNSWTISGVTVTTADFQSVSVTGLDAPRQADGSLPDIPNFHLAANSALIDKGTDVGLPFAGKAPDLGCFETGLAAGGAAMSSGGASAAGGATATGGRSAAAGGNGSSGGRVGAGGVAANEGGATARAGAGATEGGMSDATGGTSPAAGAAAVSSGGTISGSAGLGAGGASVNGGASAQTGGYLAYGGTFFDGEGDDLVQTKGCGCRVAGANGGDGSALAALFSLAGAVVRRRLHRKR